MDLTQSSKELVIYRNYYRIALMIFVNLFLLYGKEKITFDYINEKVSTALLYLNENHGLIIVYPDDIDGYTQSSICNKCNVEKALSSILEETGLSYRKLEINILFT